MKDSYHRRVNSGMPTALVVITTVAVFLLLLLLFSRSQGISIAILMNDPFSTMNAPIYTGISSNIGIIFWFSAAAICLYSYMIIKNNIYDKSVKLFVLFTGILTLYLALDDFFMLHEIYRDFLHVPEILTYIIYGILMVVYLLKFSNMILESEYSILLILAFIFMGSSIMFDTMQKISFIPKIPYRNFFEDGFKLIGIIYWFSFIICYCKKLFIQALPYKNTQQDKPPV